MRRAVLPLAIALSCVAIAIFSLIPGPSHPFASGDDTGPHVRHALLFGALAILGVIWARFAVNAR